ncbi:Membrane attack complex component/perforin (MACPF) domain [Macleaya cordata]|uniref:Membrane attack complex component/perforin (MACPF) domain n=1 Tax=Macleaya cordata TaxID=56857 RepID=A0A200PZY5_MACCD|nr:Membrane attack complex component/perforin (MACPF) domain [Macleaya cordata]
MNLKASPLKVAETAIQSIGLGYDIASDLRLEYCKRDHSPDPCLIELDEDPGRDIVLPGGISIPNVSNSIKCDKGERMRFSSDVLSFQQMSEQFNQEISLSGRIPSGLFNTMFEFSGWWQKDAVETKTLAFDGWFFTLYTIALAKSQIVLHDHVRQAVPLSWDPAALARFIEKFGTHVIVGVKMGGKDVIYIKQQHSSNLQPAEVQKRLKEMADDRFIDANGKYIVDPEQMSEKGKVCNTFVNIFDLFVKDIVTIHKRRGGSDNKNLSHNEWIQTVQFEPGVISMSFVPISSLLNGVSGSGYVSHAINLYMRYKPPIEELQSFLEFQLPRQWAPVSRELTLGPLRKQQSNASLQFSLMGPKLYVNTSLVDVGKRPVTGLRLYLEGKRSNRLAVHLQHLSSLPQSFELHDDPNVNFCCDSYDRKYYEKVQSRNFSHVCTAPVESDEDLSIVTGAHFQVCDYGLMNKVLFLRLRFSIVSDATLVKLPEWDGFPGVAPKSGIFSGISSHFTTASEPPRRPADVNINSALYPAGPPGPVPTAKLLRFVDTTEITRGPENLPGYWVVSGARLLVERGRISLSVKYSLLTVCSLE